MSTKPSSTKPPNTPTYDVEAEYERMSHPRKPTGEELKDKHFTIAGVSTTFLITLIFLFWHFWFVWLFGLALALIWLYTIVIVNE